MSSHSCKVCGEITKVDHSHEPKKHDWKIEGPIEAPGPKFYWICRTCGASGGPSFLPWEQLEVKEPRWEPFLSGTPLQPVSRDCNEAKRQIDEFVEKYPEWKEYVDRARNIVTFQGTRL